MFSAALALVALLPVLPALADPVPSEPAPGSVFNEGTTCHIAWEADPSNEAWKVMNIQLMTGDNFNMVHLTTVATVDGTDPSSTSFDYPCPAVEPNSAIYFYQFTSPDALGAPTWTGRFAIASASGQTTPPSESTQPGGEEIPWGTGRLEDPGSAVPPPAYLGGGGATTPGGSTTTSSTVSPTAVPPTTAVTRTTSIRTTTSSTPATRSTSVSGAQGSGSSGSDAPESTANGAVAMGSSRLMSTGAALAAVALVFVAAL